MNELESFIQFIKDLRPHYESGVRKVTLPNPSWLKYGILQIEFPDLIYINDEHSANVEIAVNNPIQKRINNGEINFHWRNN